MELNYSEKIRDLREEFDIKQLELAEYLGIDKTTYGHYEKQDSIVPIKHLNSICNYFHVSFDYIFGFTNTRNYKHIKEDLDSIQAGKRLKEFRKNNQLTQAKLAELLNTTQAVIANYERGRNIIATPFLYTICSEYNISADYLLSKTDDIQYL